MNSEKKLEMRLLSFVLALAMAVIMVPMFGVEAWAEEVSNVKYIDADGNEQTCATATDIESSTSGVTWGTAGTESWYVVTGEAVTISGSAVVQGNVNLILADGGKLTVTGSSLDAGIRVSGDSNSLTIYGQTNGTGQLITTGGNNGAGIGGDDAQIRGHGNGSNITINGGIVEAYGGNQSSGIGGGAKGNGSYIIINGGTVTAFGGSEGKGGAGIGGGALGSGSNITINGGTVTALGGSYAAGIGGGYKGNGSNITISGGTVTATGGNMTYNGKVLLGCCDKGAGIGGGQYGAGSNITINGGTVTATGGDGDAGIGSGTGGSAASGITVNSTLLLKAGTDKNNLTKIAHVNGVHVSDLSNKQYVTIEPGSQQSSTVSVNYKYPIYNDDSNTALGVSNWAIGTTDAAVITSANKQVTWEPGWYVVNSDVTISGGAIVSGGAVHLILADGCSITLSAIANKNVIGIKVNDGASLTIYEGSTSGNVTGGALNINSDTIGDYNAYGIYGVNGASITINGGKVTAHATTTGSSAATYGIRYDKSSITINGGIVTASGSNAIYGKDQSSIVITGGKVVATSNVSDDIIGYGICGEGGSSITITGGEVTATGNATVGRGYGICGKEGSSITITGGKITATGNTTTGRGYGIRGEEYSPITITDGTVTASGIGTSGAGICGEYISNITVSGGTVAASGSSCGIYGEATYWDEDAGWVTESAVYVNGNLVLKSGNEYPLTTIIPHTSEIDVATSLSGMRYASIMPDSAQHNTSITVSAISTNKVYDGTALTISSYTSEGSLNATDILEVQFGSITRAGTQAAITKVKVKRGGEDVSAEYDIHTEGILTVSPRAVTLTSGTSSKEYDGTALTNSSISVSGEGFVSGDVATYTFTGSQTTEGSSENTFTVTVKNSDDEDVTDCYDITTVAGILTVSPKQQSYTWDDSETPEITIPVSNTEEGSNATKVTVLVSGSNATVTIKKNDLKHLKENGTTVSGNPTGVQIDLSTLSSDVSSVTINYKTFKEIAKIIESNDNDYNYLEIKFPNSTVILYEETVEALAEQSSGSYVKLVVDQDSKAESTMTAAQKTVTSEMNNPAVYDAYFESNGERISDFKGGTAAIKGVYPTTNPVRVWYLDEKGNKEAVDSVYDGETVTFIIEHFSHYVIEELDGSSAEACPQDSTCVYAHFTDADTTAWYHAGVHFCVEKKYMGGTGVDTFAPLDTLSRGMVVTMLWRLEGQPEVAASNSYTDVAANKWYTTAVAWAEVNGIAGGYGGGKFGPEDPITREQLANIFYRYAAYKGYDISAQSDIAAKFTDAANTSSWAEIALKWANAVAIINGKENNRLDPTGNAARAEAAAILYNFCSKVAK